MELIDLYGAFGRFQFDKGEQEALDTIKQVFDETRKNNSNLTSFYLREACRADQKIAGDAAKLLLPDGIYLEGTPGSYLNDDPEGPKYFRGHSERQISLYGLTDFHRGKIIVASGWPENCHFLSFMTNRRGRPSLTDDLVNVLGKASTPVLYGLQPSINDHEFIEYGFPQVHRFKEIAALYEKANGLWKKNNTSKTIYHELKLLEQSITEDNDPALTEIREQMYHRKLAELFLSGPK